MPHVILSGPVTAEDIWIAFSPTQFTEHGIVYKAEEAFLSNDKEVVLIRSLTVERGFTKRFFVRILQKEGKLNIGLDRMAPPEKSEGVKRLLGLYAWKIMQAEPDAVVESTNISDYLGEPEA